MTTIATERRSEVRPAPPTAAPALTPQGDLPSWPIVCLFAGYAVWWVLGLSAFVVPILGIAMVGLLFVRKNVVFPRGFYLWALFLLFVLGAVAEVGFGVRIVGYGVRVSNYIGSGVVFLYIYNSSRRTLSDRKIVFAMVGFFATIVVGGYLGVLMPGGHINTPAQYLLPHAIASNSYVHTLVHPSFAEVQQPWGSPISFTRPSAPFPYTNGWGCNVALVLPFVMAALTMTRGRKRLAISGLLVAVLVPAFATLNRGMFIAVGFALIYAAVRYGMRGRIAPLAILVVGLTTVAIVAISTGVLTTLTTRLQYSSTNIGRATIYQEAFNGALASPLFGNGAPRPSGVLNISVGTQGQLWTVLFSYGFIALGAYLGWFIYAAWRSRRATTNLVLWMHIVCLIALVTCIYYGYDGPQLAVAMVAAAVALRPRERRTDQ
jgi:polysaccharide biosynthesis protein PslJ